MTRPALSHETTTIENGISHAADPASETTHLPHERQSGDWPNGDPALSPRLTLGWVLKRSALGIVILVTSITAIAWLMHATIKPSTEEANSAPLNAQQEPIATGATDAAPAIAPSATPLALPQATPVALQ